VELLGEVVTDPTGLILACADLMGRVGATAFEFGWECPHSPDVDDGHNCPDVVYNVHAQWKGTRRMFTDPNPSRAAMLLAVDILQGSVCRCGKPVALNGGGERLDGCLWSIKGNRWEPSCDAPSIEVEGPRGDLDGMKAAWDAAHQPNRQQRRANNKRKRRNQ